MVSIAGSKKLKRQMAPQFWGIARKSKRFVITVRPGPHKKSQSIPTAVFLRDTLKLVTTLREAKTAIYSGKVKIDFVPFFVFILNIDFVSSTILPFNPIICGFVDWVISVCNPINSCDVMLSIVIISLFSSRLL